MVCIPMVCIPMVASFRIGVPSILLLSEIRHLVVYSEEGGKFEFENT